MYHSGDRKLYVDKYPGDYPFLHGIFAKAYQNEWKLKRIDDLNADENIGYEMIQDKLYKGKQHTTARYFVTNRSNLHIIRNANVTKILIENGKAIGVDFMFRGTQLQAKVTIEMILSARTISTPHFLILSQTVQRDHLNSWNIQTVNNLPVGDNLQDPSSCYIILWISSKNIPWSQIIIKVLAYININIATRTGMYAITGSALHILINTNNINSKYSNVHILHYGFRRFANELTSFLNVRIKSRIKTSLI